MRHIYIENMSNTVKLRNLREENSSKFPAQWIYRSIKAVLNSLSTIQIALN